MKRFFFPFSVFVALAFVMAPIIARADRFGADLERLESLESIEEIHLRTGDLPTVTLTRDILFHILVAELSAQRGDYDHAGRIFVELARSTLDPRLAKRGFQAAMASRDMARAYQAAREWALLAPNDAEAVASSLALAATSGRTSGLAAALTSRIHEADDKEQAIIQASGIVSKMQDKRIALEVLEDAIQDDLLDMPIARLALADAAWAALDPYRALEESQAAIKLDPDSEQAAQRVLEYGQEVDGAAAVRQTQQWLATHPDARKLQLMLVSRLTQQRDYDAALTELAAMRDRAPEDFDLLYTEAEVHARAENYDRATELLNEYIDVQMQRRQSLHDNATTAIADASDARLLLVRIAEQQQDYPEAIAQIEMIDDPSMRFQAQVHKAVLQGRMGNLPLARRTIEGLAVRDDRDRSVAALTLAAIYRDAGRTDDAVELLEQADKELPDTSEIKYDLAMLYERQGRMDDFESLMRRVIELSPDNANAYNSLGYTYADQNRRLDEAQDLLERALELDPDNPYILDSVGWYFYRVDDLEAAVEYLQRSFDQLPEADVAAHLGEVLWVTGHRDDAREIWRQGVKRDADNDTLVKTLKRFGVSLP